jgi:hypothetical protein
MPAADHVCLERRDRHHAALEMPSAMTRATSVAAMTRRRADSRTDLILSAFIRRQSVLSEMPIASAASGTSERGW